MGVGFQFIGEIHELMNVGPHVLFGFAVEFDLFLQEEAVETEVDLNMPGRF